MSGLMILGLDISIINLRNMNYFGHPLVKTHIRMLLFASYTIYLGYIWYVNVLWRIHRINYWKQIRGLVKWNSYVKAAVHITIAYANLLVVNTRYISALIIPITVLIFIGAVFVVVAPKGSLEGDDDYRNKANKADEVGTACNADGNNGCLDDIDNGLLATAVAPCWLLCCMGHFDDFFKGAGHFNADNLVVSQFLLFLTSTMGELTLMMARLPSDVALAFQVIRRASLVMVVVTAHTMAAELLGDGVVLACTPELITGLLWFSIQFGQGRGPATISTGMVTSHHNAGSMAKGIKGGAAVQGSNPGTRWLPMKAGSLSPLSINQKAGFMVLGAGIALLTRLVASMDDDGTQGATNLPSKHRSLASFLVACAVSVPLTSLSVFALRGWHGITAPSSSELEGAIRWLSICRDIQLCWFLATYMFVVTTSELDRRHTFYGTMLQTHPNAARPRLITDTCPQRHISEEVILLYIQCPVLPE
ncbi:unnamed protein product [Urochloa humidicola]